MKYYNVIILILIILLVAVSTTGCKTIKTEHYIKIDHNININISKPVFVNVEHKHYYDDNKTKKRTTRD